MKKSILFILLIFSYIKVGAVMCMCEEFGVGTWTTYTYNSEGGCCSGIPSEGSIQHNYVENEGVYALESSKTFTGEFAQSHCCP